MAKKTDPKERRRLRKEQREDALIGDSFAKVNPQVGNAAMQVMRHALGVHPYRSGKGRRWKKPYRNHFVAGEDHAVIWDGLVSDGFATKGGNNAITGGNPVYYVTDVGREHALAGIAFKTRWGYGEPTNA